LINCIFIINSGIFAKVLFEVCNGLLFKINSMERKELEEDFILDVA